MGLQLHVRKLRRATPAGGGGGGALFSDGVESGDLSALQNGVEWGGTVAASVSSTRAYNGTYSVKMSYGPDAEDADSNSELDIVMATPMQEIWVSYWLYVPTNYYHRTQAGSNNNKGFLYAWNGNYSGGSGPGMGPNFFTGYGGPTADAGPGESRMKLYLFNGGGRDEFYEDTQWMAIEDEDKGKWVNIVVHYKYATAANNDGVATIWKTRDGVTARLFHKTDGDWYVSGAPGYDHLRILGWANSGFTDLTEFFVDDFQLSSTNIFGVS